MRDQEQIKQNKKVSVIIPVYNTEKYLGECIDSVLHQTYNDLEIILVDDGSEDNSGKICDDYAAKDGRIIVIHKKNGGPSSARNAGIRVATGDFLYFIDSDDYIAPNAIELLTDYIIIEKADFVYYDIEIVIETENKFGYYTKAVHTLNHETMEGYRILKRNISLKEHYPTICTMFFRKDFVLENNLFFKRMIHEDDLYSLAAYFSAERVAYLNKALYYRRFRSRSIMHGQIGESSLKGYNTCVEVYGRMLKKYQHDDDRNYILLSLIDEKANMVVWIYSMLGRKRGAVKKQYFQTCRILSGLNYCNDAKLRLKIRHPLVFRMWNILSESAVLRFLRKRKPA